MKIIKKIVKKYLYRIGKNVKLLNGCQVDSSSIQGNTEVGTKTIVYKSKIIGNVQIGKNCKIYYADINGNNIHIGNNTSVSGPNVQIYQKINKIIIGSYCSIARNTTFQEHNHNAKKISTHFIGLNIFNEKWENEFVSKGDIKVGNDVWIGTACVILGGAIIGDGAIVAANSVVIGEVPPYSIVAGSPAKVIGFRFCEEIISNLKELKWWEWSEEKIIRNKDLFMKELTIENIKMIVD